MIGCSGGGLYSDLVCGGTSSPERECGAIGIQLRVRALDRDMAHRSEEEMWTAFRELDRKIRSLSEVRDYLVEQEADACEAADRLELKVHSLTRKYERLRTEAEQWVADIAREGLSSLRNKGGENNAQMMLQTVREEIRQLCVRARTLDDKRWLFRYNEHYCEDGQYELEDTIDRLKADLEKILSQGFTSS